MASVPLPIRSRKDFQAALAEAIGVVAELVRAAPRFEPYLEIEMQLDAMRRWTADGREPLPVVRVVALAVLPVLVERNIVVGEEVDLSVARPRKGLVGPHAAVEVARGDRDGGLEAVPADFQTAEHVA